MGPYSKPVKQYLSNALKVASHPVRRQLLKELKKGESLSVVDISKILEIDRVNLYHHIETLENHYLIQLDDKLTKGKVKYYKIFIVENPIMAAFSFDENEISNNKIEINKFLDIITSIENYDIPNRDKISMIEINISYNQ